MWGKDMTTTLKLEEGRANVFITYDHYSKECVGIYAFSGQNHWKVLKPFRQGNRDYFGTAQENSAEGLNLQHDHGTQYMALEFRKEIKWWGSHPHLPLCTRQNVMIVLNGLSKPQKKTCSG